MQLSFSNNHIGYPVDDWILFITAWAYHPSLENMCLSYNLLTSSSIRWSLFMNVSSSINYWQGSFGNYSSPSWIEWETPLAQFYEELANLTFSQAEQDFQCCMAIICIRIFPRRCAVENCSYRTLARCIKGSYGRLVS